MRFQIASMFEVVIALRNYGRKSMTVSKEIANGLILFLIFWRAIANTLNGNSTVGDVCVVTSIFICKDTVLCRRSASPVTKVCHRMEPYCVFFSAVLSVLIRSCTTVISVFVQKWFHDNSQGLWKFVQIYIYMYMSVNVLLSFCWILMIFKAHCFTCYYTML